MFSPLTIPKFVEKVAIPPETVIQLLDALQVTVHTAYTGYECVS